MGKDICEATSTQENDQKPNAPMENSEDKKMDKNK
jgi:hypothetical protein